MGVIWQLWQIKVLLKWWQKRTEEDMDLIKRHTRLLEEALVDPNMASSINMALLRLNKLHLQTRFHIILSKTFNNRKHLTGQGRLDRDILLKQWIISMGCNLNLLATLNFTETLRIYSNLLHTIILSIITNSHLIPKCHTQ